MKSGSVENNWQRFAIRSLTIGAVKKIVFASDKRKQEIGDKQYLSCRNHEGYCKVEVGVSAAGINPQMP